MFSALTTTYTIIHAKGHAVLVFLDISVQVLLKALQTSMLGAHGNVAASPASIHYDNTIISPNVCTGCNSACAYNRRTCKSLFKPVSDMCLSFTQAQLRHRQMLWKVCCICIVGLATMLPVLAFEHTFHNIWTGPVIILQFRWALLGLHIADCSQKPPCCIKTTTI